MHHFLALDWDQQQGAILRLAASGYTADGIASATRLSVEQVRQILGASAPTVTAIWRGAREGRSARLALQAGDERNEN